MRWNTPASQKALSLTASAGASCWPDRRPDRIQWSLALHHLLLALCSPEQAATMARRQASPYPIKVIVGIHTRLLADIRDHNRHTLATQLTRITHRIRIHRTYCHPITSNHPRPSLYSASSPYKPSLVHRMEANIRTLQAQHTIL